MLLSLDGTLVVQVVNFIVFLAILNVIFLRPVGRAIAERRAFINGIATDIERFEGEIKSLRGQAEERRAAARRDADRAIAEARAQAQNEATAIVAGYQEQANGMIAQSQATVALEATRARGQETELVDSLARTMLERAVGAELAV